MNRVGAVLVETYRIERLVGEGGMGSVYEATHLRLPKKVAVKFLNVSLVGNLEALLRFRREAEVVAGLDHPSIVNLFDYNLTEDGVPYIVLEFLDGEHLGTRLRRGKLPLGETMRIFVPVAQALEFAHRKGIVHRDLKPENIIILRNEQVKVVDFGIAKIRGGLHLTAHNTILGTVPYMAPEQLVGGEVDARSDQFALAVIVYEMLSGAMAFPGEDIMTSAAKVAHLQPPPIDGVGERVNRALARAMAKKQADRFPSVEAFSHEMVEAASSPRAPTSSGAARRDSTPPPAKITPAASTPKPVLAKPAAPSAVTPKPVVSPPAAAAPAKVGSRSGRTPAVQAAPAKAPAAPSGKPSPLPLPAGRTLPAIGLQPPPLSESSTREVATDPEMVGGLPPLAGDATTVTMRPEGSAPVEEDPNDQVADPPLASGDGRAKRVSTDPDMAPPPPRPREPPRFDITAPVLQQAGTGELAGLAAAAAVPPWDDGDMATIQMFAAPPREGSGEITDRRHAVPPSGEEPSLTPIDPVEAHAGPGDITSKTAPAPPRQAEESAALSAAALDHGAAPATSPARRRPRRRGRPRRARPCPPQLSTTVQLRPAPRTRRRSRRPQLRPRPMCLRRRTSSRFRSCPRRCAARRSRR
jgi:serine/threonine-protein kinase